MEALGIHCCAGEMAKGVNTYFDIEECLAHNAVGAQTLEEVHDIRATVDWLGHNVDFVFGVPQTLEHTFDVVRFGALYNAQVIAFDYNESLYRLGKQHLAELIGMCENYRIAHIQYNLLSFGLPINRRRYMFVAYRKGLTFNVSPPEYNALCLRDVLTDTDDEPNIPLLGGLDLVLPKLPCGWSMSQLIHHKPTLLTSILGSNAVGRSGDKHLSFLALKRAVWGLPISRLHPLLIHPSRHRTFSISELATCAGWSCLPRGAMPVQQIMHSGFANVGKWIAEQVLHCINGAWGADDYESTYDKKSEMWQGKSTVGADEKTFNMVEYI